MKNKLMATVAVSALAAAVSVAAQAEGHPYAGASAAYVYTDGDRELSNTTAAGLQAGYQFNNDWAAEVGYMTDNGFMHPNNTLNYYNANAIYHILGDEWRLIGLVGLNQTSMDHETDVGVDDDTTQLTMGVGVSRFLTENVEMRGTVQTGWGPGAEEFNDGIATVAVNYHFGTAAPAEKPAPVAVVAPAKKAEPVVIMKKTLHAHFDHDSTVVKAEDKKEISDVAAAMKNNPGSKADLVGHTDSQGSDAYNQKLSEKRAAAVKAELVKQGASADAITTSGEGEKTAVGDNATAQGRAANRRVEATVTGE